MCQGEEGDTGCNGPQAGGGGGPVRDEKYTTSKTRTSFFFIWSQYQNGPASNSEKTCKLDRLTKMHSLSPCYVGTKMCNKSRQSPLFTFHKFVHKALVGSMQLRHICGGKISYQVPFLLCLNSHMTLSHQATAKKGRSWKTPKLDSRRLRSRLLLTSWGRTIPRIIGAVFAVKEHNVLEVQVALRALTSSWRAFESALTSALSPRDVCNGDDHHNHHGITRVWH